MATTRITELDFDGIKSNLIAYLSDKDKIFGDSFNFEGSVISSILDVLAYNTHYMAYYVNMLANEMFLDSATERDSVTSIAKHLGYTPKSTTCASVVLSLTTTDPTTTIPENSIFTTGDQAEYSFYTLDSYTAVDSKVDVTCYEGSLITQEYVVVNDGISDRYLLRKGVDTSTLSVLVRDSYTTNVTSKYKHFSDISELNSTSLTYFLNEVEEQQYEVVFGDGIFGKSLSNGNVVQIKYLISSYDPDNDKDTNNYSTFTDGNSSDVGISGDIKAKSPSSGAKSIESIDSIKFMAPKSFQSQNRTVTAVDYKNFILSNYSNARSVLTWGGENNDPPAYGKVFIAVRPTSGYYLTETDRKVLTEDVLSKNKIVGITPEIIDPDYTFIKIDSTVKYNVNTALQPSGTIASNIRNTITNFVTANLDEFGGSLRSSQLSGDIDDTYSAILSNYTVTTLYKLITPELGNAVNTDQFKFNSTFISLSSDSFNIEDRSYSVRFSNNGNLVTLVDENGIVVVDNVGSITSNGEFSLAGLNIVSSNDINLYLTTDQIDIVPLRNQILTVKTEDITVNMVRG